MKYYAVVPGVAWFIISTILLCLPGEELPEPGFLNIPYQDKYVHVIIFFLLVSLFALPLRKSGISIDKKKSWVLSIALYCLAYGIIIEFVQEYFIPNRSFDIYDIVADTFGCFAAYFFSRKYLLEAKYHEDFGGVRAKK